jgi:hypothetical protein
VAILLYAHVYTEREQETDFVLPVHVVGVGHGLSVAAVRPRELKVKVAGSGKDMLRMRVRPPILELNVDGIRSGMHKVETTSARVLFPLHSDARLAQIVGPPTVLVALDTLTVVRFLVNPVVTGRPAPGYIQSAAFAEPESVDLLGPKRLLDDVEQVKTVPVDVSGRTRDVRRDVRLAVPQAVAPRPPHVRVTVRIAELHRRET